MTDKQNKNDELDKLLCLKVIREVKSLGQAIVQVIAYFCPAELIFRVSGKAKVAKDGRIVDY